jgi:hypothetical protein
LRKLVKESCAEASYPYFKDVPMSWGVTLEANPRFAGAEFGLYKSADRLATEKKLREYMREPSKPRAEPVGFNQMKDFTIAVTVAAPGTGKTRLVDDAMRMPLDANPNEAKHFDHFLRLAVMFNSNYSGTYAHPVTARMLLVFFCGTVHADASIVLDRIDTKLLQLFPNEKAKFVAQKVLDALEALYCEQRGCVLERCRTVLLIDEISKARMIRQTSDDSQELVYDAVVNWLDDGLINDTGKSRRGAVFTGLSAVAPWSERTPKSGRRIVWLPLGIFDVFDQQVRDVIADQAKLVPGWPAEQQLSERVFYLLAASGGRPRDLSSMLRSLCDVDLAFEPYPDELLRALFEKEPDECFQRYLLASMLGITFRVLSFDRATTRFGADAVSRALLNGDLLALGALAPPAVPAVSLGHATALKPFCADLFRVVRALIWSTTFVMRDGSGKDFERVWLLLVHAVLRLQQIVRCTKDDFWPKPEGAVVVGGLARPKGKALNVFATGDDEEERVCALFGRPADGRTFTAPGSSINRNLSLVDVPKLAWWQSAWTRVVQPGDIMARPPGWPVSREVEWRSWTVVYFAEATHAAVDFALMVGDAGGTGDKAPHLYLFTKTTKEDSPMAKIVGELQAQLDLLFSDDFAATHVWRRAGINSAKQVTLCVAAINLSDKLDLKKLNAPFSVVLFDEDDFRALGGAAFRNTCFFRNLDKMNLN